VLPDYRKIRTASIKRALIFPMAQFYGVITPLESFRPSGIMFQVSNKLNQTNNYYAKITN